VQQGALTWAVRAVAALLAALAVVLVVSGVWLWFHYHPVPAAWNVTANEHLRDEQRWRIVHQLASTLTLGLAGLLAVLLVVRRWRSLLPAAGIVLVVAAAAFTGQLVAWDQLSLRAVTVGSNYYGLRGAFDDQVVFVLVDGVEVAATTFRRWAVVHVALPPVAALLAALRFAVGRRRARVAKAANTG
jgi:quinol-cytochrome oxidoreductase complex cytochrome b subunit